MIAYLVEMNQVMESFESGHTFSTAHDTGAKELFKCNHQNPFIIFQVIIRNQIKQTNELSISNQPACVIIVFFFSFNYVILGTALKSLCHPNISF